MPKLNAPLDDAPAPKATSKRPAPAQPKPVPNADFADEPFETVVETSGKVTKAKPAKAEFSFGTPLVEAEDFANVMYSGDGGTGKTTDLADMARLGKVLVINAESGLKSGPLKRLGIPIENITFWPNREKGEELTFETLDKLVWDLKDQLEAHPGSIVGVMMDSATEVHIALLDKVREVSVGKSLKKGVDREKFATEVQDYGIMTEQMRNILRRLRDLPCHFGVSTLAKRDKDDDGRVVYRSDMTEKLANSLFGYVDIVIVTTLSEAGGVTDYVGLTAPIGKYRGKDRFGVLPQRFVTPTFTRVLAYMRGEVTSETDPIQADARNRRMAEEERPPEVTEETE